MLMVAFFLACCTKSVISSSSSSLSRSNLFPPSILLPIAVSALSLNLTAPLVGLTTMVVMPASLPGEDEGIGPVSVDVNHTLVSLMVLNTSKTLSVKSIPPGLVNSAGDTNEGGVRELSIKMSLVEGLVFGGFKIVDVDVSLLFELITAAKTRL